MRAGVAIAMPRGTHIVSIPTRCGGLCGWRRCGRRLTGRGTGLGLHTHKDRGTNDRQTRHATHAITVDGAVLEWSLSHRRLLVGTLRASSGWSEVHANTHTQTHTKRAMHVAMQTDEIDRKVFFYACLSVCLCVCVPDLLL